ncbi:MAG: hypothetical protein IJU70_12040 [Lentisphaeria bacterium]|nr:hypothetical protein [Lentisphaeria bacterium]
MRLIDLKLSNAFRRMRATVRTNVELADKLGLSRAHVGRILKGEVYYLDDKTWVRIEKLVTPYISDEDPSNVVPVQEKIKSFPVISEAAAAMCNTAFIPIADWASDYAENFVSFSEGRPGDFVLRVSGDSMLPWYPPNTLILARPNERLKNGDRVIAVLEDGSVVFKVFAENEKFFFLLSINETDGRDFKFEKNNFSAVRGIYLVIQSMRDERALDRAMTARGITHFWQNRMKNLENA